jgi:hypothetical protein
MKNPVKRKEGNSSRLTSERAVHKPPRTSLRRKNLILNQEKIDRAREIFGVTTDTEAINLALDAANDLALFRTEVDVGFEKLLGKEGFTDYFPPLR